jgi:enoyl-CoA hydratase/carnithine racemase
VPGDGVHSLWPEVIGSIRGRTFLLTQQILRAEEVKTLGVVSEIVERKDLMGRARELAGRSEIAAPHRQLYTDRVDADAAARHRRERRLRSRA